MVLQRLSNQLNLGAETVTNLKNILINVKKPYLQGILYFQNGWKVIQHPVNKELSGGKFNPLPDRKLLQLGSPNPETESQIYQAGNRDDLRHINQENSTWLN